MDETFDREKIIDCMFDPITSSILAELEDGEKDCSFLAQKSSISESEVLERLSYLIEHGFISKTSDDRRCLINANSEKLGSIIENSDNFDAAINGLEKMDSYLNWFFLFLISYTPTTTNPIMPIIRINVEIMEMMNFLYTSGSGPIAPAT